jgi:hypothetical protein
VKANDLFALLFFVYLLKCDTANDLLSKFKLQNVMAIICSTGTFF